MSNSLGPHGYTVHGILQARILEWVAVPSPRDLANPGIEPWFPALQAYSLPAEPPREPTSSQGHTKITTIYRVTLVRSEN